MCCGEKDDTTMATPNLNVHDIKVTDHTYFTPSGAVAKQRTVTYFVGDHGPFTLTYDPADATPDRIKQDIRQHVADLQSIGELAV
jgi:hypothetical protein